MKVALYARVSMDEKNEDDARYQEPENQLQPLREWAKLEGYEITEEYVDRMSGGNPARPQFRKLIDDALMHRFNGILVWKLDRFSREEPHLVYAYLRKIKDRHVFIRSLTESWADTREENPTSDLLFFIFAWVANQERQRISERTKAGIRRLRAIGQWKGGRPKKGGSQNEAILNTQ